MIAKLHNDAQKSIQRKPSTPLIVDNSLASFSFVFFHPCIQKRSLGFFSPLQYLKLR